MNPIGVPVDLPSNIPDKNSTFQAQLEISVSFTDNNQRHGPQTATATPTNLKPI